LSVQDRGVEQLADRCDEDKKHQCRHTIGTRHDNVTDRVQHQTCSERPARRQTLRKLLDDKRQRDDEQRIFDVDDTHHPDPVDRPLGK